MSCSDITQTSASENIAVMFGAHENSHSSHSLRLFFLPLLSFLPKSLFSVVTLFDKIFIFFLGVTVLIMMTVSGPIHADDTLRCGQHLISLGDRKFEVQKKCGDPILSDRIGYTLGGYDRREFQVDEWVYGPQGGVYRVLTFEANRLVSIETRREF